MSLVDRLNFREPGEPPQADEHAALSSDAPMLDPDPEPGRRRATRREPAGSSGRTSTRRKPTIGPRVQTSAKVRAEIQQEMEMWLKLLAGGWSLSCEICGAAAEEAVPKTAAALTDLVARSDFLVEKFHQTSMMGDVVKVLVAAKPVAQTAFHHKDHHSHDEGGVPDDLSRFQAY